MSLRALQIARSAMTTQSTVMDLVAQNVANVSTPGYVRRRVALAEIPGESSSSSVAAGRGVEVTTIQRMGDRLLEAQINLQSGELGRQQVYASTLSDLETIVAGSGGDGLQTALNDLFDAFSTVASDPTSATGRQQVVTAAQTLTDSLRGTHSALADAISRNDEQVAAGTAQVNALARQVADLNVAIGQAGGAGAAPELEDQRSYAIEQMATLCGAVAIGQENGYVDVVLGGQHLVQGETVAALSVQSQAVTGHPTLHTYTVQVTTNGLTTDATSALVSGELAGYLQAGERLNQAVTDTSEFAARIADEINTAHAAGYGQTDDASLTTPPDRDLFTFTTSGPDDWAAGIEVNADIVADPRLFKAASRPGETGNGEVALQLEALRSTSGTTGEASLIETQAAWLAGVGQEVQLGEARAASQATITEALEARYQATAGVSLDEEALDLAAAEKAYSAAQRVALIALEMIDAALALAD